MHTHTMKTNKYTKLGVLAIGFLISVSSAKAEHHAKTDDHSKDRAFLQEAIRRMDVAGQNKDADKYVAYTHPDFVNVNQFGQEDIHGKAERREKFIHAASRVTSLSEVTAVTSIVFSKGTAIVSESAVTHITLNINGETAELVDHDTFRDLWVKSGTGWLEMKSRTLTSKSTLNGQPLPPPRLSQPNTVFLPTPNAKPNNQYAPTA